MNIIHMNCGLIESWFILHIEDLLQGSIEENIDKGFSGRKGTISLFTQL